jgi:hypothetical protein
MSPRLRLFPEPVEAVEQLHMQQQPHSGVGIGDARRVKQLSAAPRKDDAAQQSKRY